MKREGMKEISRETGLPLRLIRKLMKRGWTYHMGYRNVPYFEHPRGSFKKD